MKYLLTSLLLLCLYVTGMLVGANLLNEFIGSAIFGIILAVMHKVCDMEN